MAWQRPHTSIGVHYGASPPGGVRGGERRILLLAASLAGGIPVSLRDTVTGLDEHNTARLLNAVRHATGKRPKSSGYR